MKAIQYFTPDYLKHSMKLSTEEILRSLEDFRLLHAHAMGRSKLISIKIPQELLNAFRTKAKANGIPYQTQIKQLMRNWIMEMD